jgi:hypothetical protein
MASLCHESVNTHYQYYCASRALVLPLSLTLAEVALLQRGGGARTAPRGTGASLLTMIYRAPGSQEVRRFAAPRHALAPQPSTTSSVLPVEL